MATAILAILAGMAVPGVLNEVDRLKLGTSTRDIASTLQTARLKAVSSNTYMRVRFNCPVAGQYRIVERIGPPRAADTNDDLDSQAATRCGDLVKYPYKPTGADKSRLTPPNNDGPLQYLQQTVTFSTTAGISAAASKVVEFWPDGSLHVSGATPWPLVGAAGITVVLVKGANTKTITVTSLGNIQMER